MVGKRFGVWLPALAVWAAGCSGYPPTRSQVSGVVTLDGQPAAMTAVFFIPADRDRHAAGMIGQGFTDEQGRFQLKNHLGEATFYSGTFHVTFTRYVTKQGKPIPLEVKPDDVGAEQQLPPAYISPETTPFTVEVSDANSRFTFDLVSEGDGP